MLRIRLFALLIITSTFVLLGTKAQDITTIYGIVEVDQAAVRVGPDFAYDAIDQLPRDTSVTILGRAGDFRFRWDGRQWLMIQYGSGRAWVYARLVRTSVSFNSIPPRGSRELPRNRNGRVPEGFDLSTEVCTQWVGSFQRTGDFMSGSDSITVTFPALQGANLYRVVIIDGGGFRTAFDSEDTTVTINLLDLKLGADTYTWRVAPYWQGSSGRAQQVCLLETGGTFQKPERQPFIGG